MDNDTTSYLEFTDRRIFESHPPQTQLIYTGKDASDGGTLKLYFNLTRKIVDLSSINKRGKSTVIGSAECEPAEPWDDLK